jgi:chromosome segregation ATPase
MAQERAESEDQLSGLKAKLTTVRDELSSAKDNAARAAKDATTERAKSREASTAAKALETKLRRSASSSTAAEGQIAELRTTLERLEAEVAVARERVAAESARAVAAEEDSEKLVMKCGKLTSRIEAMQLQLDAATERVKKEQVRSARISPLYGSASLCTPLIDLAGGCRHLPPASSTLPKHNQNRCNRRRLAVMRRRS